MQSKSHNRRTTRFPRVAAVLVAVTAMMFTGTSCAPAASPADAPSSQDAPLMVDVGNRNWADVVVYAVRAGTRWRLGTVNSMSERSFRVPEGAGVATGTIQFLVDPIGSGRGFQTDPVSVFPGQRLRFSVEPRLPLSYVVVR